MNISNKDLRKIVNYFIKENKITVTELKSDRIISDDDIVDTNCFLYFLRSPRFYEMVEKSPVLKSLFGGEAFKTFLWNLNTNKFWKSLGNVLRNADRLDEKSNILVKTPLDEILKNPGKEFVWLEWATIYISPTDEYHANNTVINRLYIKFTGKNIIFRLVPDPQYDMVNIKEISGELIDIKDKQDLIYKLLEKLKYQLNVDATGRNFAIGYKKLRNILKKTKAPIKNKKISMYDVINKLYMKKALQKPIVK